MFVVAATRWALAETPAGPQTTSAGGAPVAANTNQGAGTETGSTDAADAGWRSAVEAPASAQNPYQQTFFQEPEDATRERYNTSAPPDFPASADFNVRLFEMQTLIESMQEGGLAPGELRTTDIPRVEDLKATPLFPKVRLSGFFQADAGYFNQDTNSVNTFGNIQDVAGFRRTRLLAVGDVADNVSYVLEMDFAFNGRPSFMDVFVDILKVPVLGGVRVGQWRMPFGMSEITSVRELMFLERSLGFAFAPFRQIGAGFFNRNKEETITWAAAVFRNVTDPWGDVVGDRGYGMAARVTALPYYDEKEGRLLHVGADYSFIAPSIESFRFRNTPEFGGPFIGPLGNLGSIPFFVDTGVVGSQQYQLFNLEGAFELGSWYVQSEARYAVVNTDTNGTSTLPAYYIQSGYFLTGEKRAYNKIAGVFARVRPLTPYGDEGFGAVELAARYSYIDLNGSGFQGGRLNDVTLGVNWYLNQYTKFQLNYIRAMLDNPVHGPSDTNIVAARAQLDF